MNHLLTFLLLSALLVASCTPDDDDSPSDDLCGTGSLESLRCALSQSSWHLEAMNSDVVRTQDGISSTDWLDFRASCYGVTDINFSGFLPLDSGTTTSLGDTVLTTLSLTGTQDTCGSTGNAFLTTADFLYTAEAIVSGTFLSYLYGPTTASVTTERWFDIEYSREEFSYSVDKTIDGIDYRVTAEFRRVP